MAASLLEHRPRGEAGSQRPEPGAQRDVQTIGEEGHEDVRLDALLQLVIAALAYDRRSDESLARFLSTLRASIELKQVKSDSTASDHDPILIRHSVAGNRPVIGSATDRGPGSTLGRIEHWEDRGSNGH